MSNVRLGQRQTLLTALLLAGAVLAFGQEKPPAKEGSPVNTPPAVQLKEAEQRDLRSLLDARLAREREYREALLAAQGAQARFEAASSSLEAAFYKLCAQYKLDPDKHELSADAKAIQAKASVAK